MTDTLYAAQIGDRRIHADSLSDIVAELPHMDERYLAADDEQALFMRYRHACAVGTQLKLGLAAAAQENGTFPEDGTATLPDITAPFSRTARCPTDRHPLASPIQHIET